MEKHSCQMLNRVPSTKFKFSVVYSDGDDICVKHHKQTILVQEIDTLKYTGHDIFDNLENQNFLHVSLNGAWFWYPWKQFYCQLSFSRLLSGILLDWQTIALMMTEIFERIMKCIFTSLLIFLFFFLFLIWPFTPPLFDLQEVYE